MSGSGKTSTRPVPLTPQTDAARRFDRSSLIDPPFAGSERDAAFELGGAFSFDAAGTYLDSELGNYISPSNNQNPMGARLPLSPEWSGSASIGYDGEVLGGALQSHLE